MGAKGSQVIDPNANTNNNPNTNNNNYNQNNKKDDKMQNQQIMQLIKQAFRNCSQNGLLTKDKFNQALAILEALGFKRLRDTPLADRLFFIFDQSKTGSISESQFIKGIGQIINNPESAINYTFRAYDRDGDNIISRKQFMQFIEESWKAAFRILSESMESKGNNNNNSIRIKDIESWTISKIMLLNEQSSQIFNKMSNGNDKLDYQAFKMLINKGEVNDITAQLDQQISVVPLNFSSLH